MPFHKRVYQHGNLIIQFKVKFPTTIDAKSSQILQEALGGAVGAAGKGKASGKAANIDAGDAEVCELKAFKEEHRNTDHRGGDRGNHESDEEDDEDGHHGGQRVGCQAQ